MLPLVDAALAAAHDLGRHALAGYWRPICPYCQADAAAIDAALKENTPA